MTPGRMHSDPQEQREYYDRRWEEEYVEELDSHQVARLEHINRALAMIDLQGSQPVKILEIGCGTGWLSGILSEHGSATGIDLSPAGIEIARERYPQVEFDARDVLAEPFEPIHDLVVASEVIEHIEDQARFVDVLVGATKPGGHILLTTPNGKVEPRWRRRPNYNPQPIENWLRPRELRALLARRCRVRWSTTFFYDFDRDGIYGLIHDDHRVERGLPPLRLSDSASRLLGRLGFGLYMVALAQRQ